MKKIIFVDFDDTLCLHPYKNETDERMFEEIDVANNLFYGDRFVNLPLYEYLIEKQNEYNIVLLTSASSKMLEIKKYWLKKNCPKLVFKDYISVSIDINKSQVMRAYSKKFGISANDIVFIDDNCSERWAAEEYGILTYNPQLIMNECYKKLKEKVGE